MKRYNLLYLCALLMAAVLSLTGCSKDNEPEVAMAEVAFTPRVQGLELGRASQEAFVLGDLVSIFAFRQTDSILESYASNCPYRCDNGKLVSTSPIAKSQADSLSYAAVYPYDATRQPRFDFAIELDQAAQDCFEKNDLLIATATRSPDADVVLEFRHCMAHITVAIDPSMDYEKVSSALLGNVGTQMSFNLLENARRTSAIGQVVMHRAGPEAFDAVVAPSQGPGSWPKLVMTIGGKVYEAEVEKELEGGKKYELALQLSDGQIEVTVKKVQPWIEGAKVPESPHELPANWVISFYDKTNNKQEEYRSVMSLTGDPLKKENGEIWYPVQFSNFLLEALTLKAYYCYVPASFNAYWFVPYGVSLGEADFKDLGQCCMEIGSDLEYARASKGEGLWLNWNPAMAAVEPSNLDSKIYLTLNNEPLGFYWVEFSNLLLTAVNPEYLTP